MVRKSILGFAAALALTAGASTSLAQVGTAVTYQGQLKTSGQVVNSPTDVRFNLYDAATGGNSVGTTDTHLAVPVVNGLFSTTFDCGVNPYSADRALWLQIDIRNPSNVGGWIPLAARQRMTGAPFSLATRGINVNGSNHVAINSAPESGVKLKVTGAAANAGSLRLMDELNGGDISFDGGSDSVAGIRHLGGVSGRLTFSSATAGNILSLLNTGRIEVPAGRAIDMGGGAVRADTNNGLIGYQLFTQGLDIVGAGSTLGEREVTLWGTSRMIGNAIVAGGGSLGIDVEGAQFTHRLTVKSTTGSNTIRVMGPTGPLDWSGQINWGDLDFVHILEPVDDVMELKARLGIQSISTFSAPAKNFRIDHPSDPQNKILNHGCIESDQYINLYRGNATISADGGVWIQLPAWMNDLNADFSYQLTSVGAAQPNLFVAAEVNHDNQFRIAGGVPGAKVSWIITGVRHDPYVLANPLVVEQHKTPEQRGTYLSPNSYGIFTPEEAAKINGTR